MKKKRLTVQQNIRKAKGTDMFNISFLFFVCDNILITINI